MVSFGDLKPENQNILLGILLPVCFALGVLLTLLFTRKSGGESSGSGSGSGSGPSGSNSSLTNNIALATTNYIPAMLLLMISIGFAFGLRYVIHNQIVDNDPSVRKRGVINAIGMSWGLFVVAAVLIWLSVESSIVSPDSKYYLIATMSTFYFATIVTEIVFINKYNDIPDRVDKLDMTSTHNLQIGLSMSAVAYGIFSFLLI